MNKKHLFWLALPLAILSPALFSQQQSGPFTAAQVDTGRAAYQASCAGCHGADLGGRNDASALQGGLFMGSWGGRTTKDLVGFLEGSMPPTNPGGLGEATYLAIAAFILDSNGARAGNQPLTAATTVQISSIATGQRLQVAQAAPQGGGRGRGGQAGGRGGN